MSTSTITPPLFVYGTLRDDDVIRAVVGRGLSALSPVPARLSGYAARRVMGEVYPGLALAAGAVAPGLLLVTLRAEDLARLDAFEGPATGARPLPSRQRPAPSRPKFTCPRRACR